MRLLLSSAMLVALGAVGPASATTVWNVNTGGSSGPGQAREITTADNYFGAATENTANSVWNPVTGPGTSTLDDSTGDDSAGVTFTVTPASGSTMNFNGNGGNNADEIFASYMKDDGNNEAYTVTFGGLSTAPGVTYDLVVYSFWQFGPEELFLEQTVGSGLTGTFILNSPDMDGVVLTSGLAEDTNAADNADNFNYTRFNGLTADGSGDLAFDFLTGGDRDAPINGFQLVEVPEPGSLALLGLGGLLIARRRR